MSNHKLHKFIHDLDLSALLTVIGVVFLFSFSVGIVLIAPHYIDPSWTQPTTPYMKQIYEVADPNLYISSARQSKKDLEFVYHIKKGYTLLAFQETETVRIVPSEEQLDKYITHLGDKTIHLTSQLLLLREKMSDIMMQKRKALQQEWETRHPNWKAEGIIKPDFKIYELIAAPGEDAFAQASTEGILENWVDQGYTITDEKVEQPYHQDSGVIYVNNPVEYRVRMTHFASKIGWEYSPDGELIASLEQLQSPPFSFISREALIHEGEHIYAVQGCWYCHTDQTRTLVQDVVLNGSASYPAPPSAANEYIYQKITFPGTRRIGPDLSRVGIKRPSRDWHIGHFWSPKTASAGSIMPAFQHFFDNDPRGQNRSQMGVPNHKFEAIYQYLMTKGTRITPPTQAWWLGKDPVQTIEIIEGRKK